MQWTFAIALISSLFTASLAAVHCSLEGSPSTSTMSGGGDLSVSMRIPTSSTRIDLLPYKQYSALAPWASYKGCRDYCYLLYDAGCRSFQYDMSNKLCRTSTLSEPTYKFYNSGAALFGGNRITCTPVAFDFKKSPPTLRSPADKTYLKAHTEFTINFEANTADPVTLWFGYLTAVTSDLTASVRDDGNSQGTTYYTGSFKVDAKYAVPKKYTGALLQKVPKQSWNPLSFDFFVIDAPILGDVQNNATVTQGTPVKPTLTIDIISPLRETAVVNIQYTSPTGEKTTTTQNIQTSAETDTYDIAAPSDKVGVYVITAVDRDIGSDPLTYTVVEA